MAKKIPLLTLSAAICAAGAISSQAAQLEEIVVTARKVKESMQDVPISVTAFTDRALDSLQVDNISEISNATPGLTFDSSSAISGSSVSSSIFIRGIGQTDFTLVSDPGVGLYVDGVYVARSVGGVLDIVDVETVEVLRGPQGTLFGKNTIGGAINIISKKPADEFGGYFQLKTGTDNRLDIKASIDIPFSDTFKARLSFADLNQDGYVENLNGGPDLSDTDAQTARALLQFDPTEQLSMSLSLDWTDRDEQGQAQRLLSFNPAAGVPLLAVVPDATFDINDFACFGSSAAQQMQNAADCSSPYVTSSASNTPSQVEVKGAAFTLEYVFDAFTFKSITGYRDMEALFARDSDNSPIIVIETIDTMEQDQFSQEFQFTGTAFDSRLNWLAGYYYFEEDGFNRNDVIASLFYIKSGGAIDNDSDALFGQLSYDITDKLSVSAGLRRTEETKRFLPDQFAVINPGFFTTHFLDNTLQYADVARGDLPGTEFDLVPSVKSERDFSETTGLLSFDYRLNENTLLYIRYATGFKSGGFNQRIGPPGLPEPLSYAPETSDSYELGWKWSNAERNLQINGSIFHTDYDDLQINVFAGIAPTTLNATSAEIDGFELELLAAPSEALYITANVSYIDAGYTEVDEGGVVDKGDAFPKTPEFTAFLGLDYTWFLSDVNELAFHIDWSYRDEVYNNTINSEQIKQDAYDVVNASLVFRNDEQWEVALSGRNLTDEIYLIAGNEELAGFGYAEAVYARDREWALSVKYNF